MILGNLGSDGTSVSTQVRAIAIQGIYVTAARNAWSVGVVCCTNRFVILNHLLSLLSTDLDTRMHMCE
jgi:hypothetical protein